MIPSHLLLAQRIRDEVMQLERSVLRVRRAWEEAEQAQANRDMFAAFSNFLEGVSQADDLT